jgi:hypothetical protein
MTGLGFADADVEEEKRMRVRRRSVDVRWCVWMRLCIAAGCLGVMAFCVPALAAVIKIGRPVPRTGYPQNTADLPSSVPSTGKPTPPDNPKAKPDKRGGKTFRWTKSPYSDWLQMIASSADVTTTADLKDGNSEQYLTALEGQARSKEKSDVTVTVPQGGKATLYLMNTIGFILGWDLKGGKASKVSIVGLMEAKDIKQKLHKSSRSCSRRERRRSPSPSTKWRAARGSDTVTSVRATGPCRRS